MDIIQNWSSIGTDETLVFSGQVEAGKTIQFWIPGVSPCINYVFDVTVSRDGGGSITKTLTQSANSVKFTNMIAGNYHFYIHNKNSSTLRIMYQITYNY